MIDLLDVEHRRRSRAERVVAMLRAMWGDALPAGPHPELTVLIDAIAIDDDHASSVGLVSQADGLTYDVLAALCVAHPSAAVETDSPAADVLAALLPPRLLTALRQLDALPLDLPRQQGGAARATSEQRRPSSAEHPTPEEAVRVGMWEVDPQTRTVAYDAVTAALMGEEAVAGSKSFDDELDRRVDPADRSRVAEAVEHALRTETTYRARYRVVSSAGRSTWLIAQGQVLRGPDDPVARLTGYVIVDPTARPGAELAELT